eukprot:CAMPEP_0170454410 /NCGR_PEP_ID=MMETSP0123-20130129/2669_1 /TAXON_ID=182087 /ORGANISM="Favella ehrenbergii, Strain Fehren 1" /LENGTH=195 /DNA_ID=CAMNT_0010717109 /DNA_START=2967 /DNA_END=3555 /DNA_ORIENTATION=-
MSPDVRVKDLCRLWIMAGLIAAVFILPAYLSFEKQECKPQYYQMGDYDATTAGTSTGRSAWSASITSSAESASGVTSSRTTSATFVPSSGLAASIVYIIRPIQVGASLAKIKHLHFQGLSRACCRVFHHRSRSLANRVASSKPTGTISIEMVRSSLARNYAIVLRVPAATSAALSASRVTTLRIASASAATFKAA